MLKASCKDLNINIWIGPDYDEHTGWGFLRADNLFNMLNEGYIIETIHDEDYNNFTYGDWSNEEIRLFINNIESKDHPKPLRTHLYIVKRREVSSIIHLPPNTWTISDVNKLYVWGRGDFRYKSGFSIAGVTNYQTNFTQVTSSTGGNGFVDGIIHNQSLDVSVRNYQYDVWLWDWPGTGTRTYIGHVPADNQLGFNIAVFGLPASHGKKSAFVDQSQNNLYCEISMYPNPIKDKANLNIFLKKASIVSFSLYDIFGNIVYKTNSLFYNLGSYSQEIDLNGFANGIYFCKLLINNTNQIFKIIKIE